MAESQDERPHPDGDAGDGAPPDDDAADVLVDPQTEALIAAAEDVRRSGPPPRPWRGPRNFLILAAALLGIAALTYYAIYFTGKLERQNSQIRMRALDQQRRKYLDEQAAFREKGYRPAGEETKPLTSAQFAELQALRQRFGHPPVPLEEAATQPSPAPITRPATTPSG